MHLQQRASGGGQFIANARCSASFIALHILDKNVIEIKLEKSISQQNTKVNCSLLGSEIRSDKDPMHWIWIRVVYRGLLHIFFRSDNCGHCLHCHLEWHWWLYHSLLPYLNQVWKEMVSFVRGQAVVCAQSTRHPAIYIGTLWIFTRTFFFFFFFFRFVFVFDDYYVTTHDERSLARFYFGEWMKEIKMRKWHTRGRWNGVRRIRYLSRYTWQVDIYYCAIARTKHKIKS